MSKNYYVYILGSKTKTLYIGVTKDLANRIYEHKTKLVKGFTEKYNINQLLYYEQFNDIEQAILREKRLKKWNREWKLNLIQEMNPDWRDLYEDIT